MQDICRKKYRRFRKAPSDEVDEDEPSSKLQKLTSSKDFIPHTLSIKVTERKRPALTSQEDFLRDAGNVKVSKKSECRVIFYIESWNSSPIDGTANQIADFQKVLGKLTEKCLSEIGFNFSHLQMLFLLSVNFEGSMELACNKASAPVVHCSCPFNLLEDILSFIKKGIGVSPFKGKPADKILYKDAWRKIIQAACASFFGILYFVSSTYSMSALFEEIVQSTIIFCQYQVVNTIGVVIQDMAEVNNCSHKILANPSAEAPLKDVQRLYKIVTFLTNVLIHHYNTKIKSDQLIYLMVELAVLPHFSNDVMNMQGYSLHLARKIVKDHKEVLPVFINKIFCQASKFANQKCSEKLYLLGSGKHVQMNTILILQLIQTSVDLSEKQAYFSEKQTMDIVYFKNNDSHSVKNDPLLKLKMKKALFSLEEALKTADKIVNLVLSNFFNQLNQKESTCHESSCHEFLEDLLNLLHEPDWPASEYLLMRFGTFISKMLNMDDTCVSLHPFLMKCLGTILKGFNCDLSPLELNHISLIVRHMKQNYGFDDSYWERNPSVPSEQNLVLLQKTLLATLIQNRENDSKIDDICQFYLAVWFNDMQTEKSKAHFLKTFIFQEYVGRCMGIEGRFFIGLNKKLVVSSINKIRRKADISNLFHNVIFQHLLKGDTKSKRAFVHVTNLLDATVNAQVLTPAIKKIKLKCFDSSSVIRRAAVGYLGLMLDSNPTEIDHVCRLLVLRVFDVNLSVRSKAVDTLAAICRKFDRCSGVWEMCVSALGEKTEKSGLAAMKIVAKNMSVEAASKTDGKDSSNYIEESVTSLINISAMSGDKFEEAFLNTFCPDFEVSKRTSRHQEKVFRHITCAIKRRICGDNLNCTTDRTENRMVLACVKILIFIARIKPDVVISCNLNWRIFSRFVYQPSYDFNLKIATADLFAIVARHLPLEEKAAVAEVEGGCYTILSVCDNIESIVEVVRCVSAIAKASRRYNKIRAFAASVYVNVKVLRRLYDEKKIADSSDEKCYLLKRTLALLGVILMYFDFDNRLIAAEMVSFTDKVISQCIYFCNVPGTSLRQTALFALGCICHGDCWLAVDEQVMSVYQQILTSDSMDDGLQIQALTNINEILRHLLDVISSASYSKQTSATSNRPVLTKNIVDRVHKVSKAIVKAYAASVNSCCFHPNRGIRSAVLTFVDLALQHKVVHRIQVMPYLICMTSDPDSHIRHSAEQRLREIEESSPGSSYRVALEAVSLSRNLHRFLVGDLNTSRGFLFDGQAAPIARMHVLYSIISASETYHTSFISDLLQELDGRKVLLDKLLFLADNIAYFQYGTRGNVLSLIRRIDDILMISCDSDQITAFRDVLCTCTTVRKGERKIIRNALRIMVLLQLREHLCRLYGISILEIYCFSQKKSYKVKVILDGKSVMVTNKTNAKMLPKKIFKIFDPFRAAEQHVDKKNFAFGFSKDALWSFLSKIEKLWGNVSFNAYRW